MPNKRRMPGMIPRPLDLRSLGEAVSFPGIDPRVWVSLAIVDSLDEIEWDPDHGPLVPITLQPSGVQTFAVCGQSVSGNQEGEGCPFVENDMVLVVNPQGLERADTVIVCRLSSHLAPPPSLCGGQDTTANKISWKRKASPHFEEYGDRWTVKSAVSDALIAFDATGQVTIRDGSKSVLQMSSSAFGYQNSDASCEFKVSTTDPAIMLKASDAMFVLSSSSAAQTTSVMTLPAALTISAGGNQPFEHAASTESVANVLFNVLTLQTEALVAVLDLMMVALTTALSTTPGLPIGTPGASAAISAITALSAVPLTALTGGVGIAATTPQNPAVSSAIMAAFLSQQPKKLPAVPGTGQTIPGIGCASLLIG